MQQNRLQCSIICREPCSVISGLYMPCPDAERPLQLARIDGEAFLNRVRKSGCRLVHDGNEARKKRGCGKSVTPRIDWSGRQDLNLRHHAPKACALPGCATPRLRRFEIRGPRHKIDPRASILYQPAPERFSPASCCWSQDLNFANARPRWLMRFLISGGSSAAVRPR
jgi:hypothetical protein